MKDGTENLAKFKLLMADLGLALWEVRGLLDSLWKFTRDNCPAGDIGRFDPAEVCVMIGWNRTPPEVLFDALKKRRWIDEPQPCGCRVAIVHDWPEHCEMSVHRSLALKGLTFANGDEPNQSKMTMAERARARKRREERNAVAGGSLPSHYRASPSHAITKPEPEPEPSPATAARDSGFSEQDRTDLTTESLADPTLLRRWFDAESRRPDAWVVDCDEHWRNVQAVAAKVLGSRCRDPVAVAKWIFRGRRWDFIAAKWDEVVKAAKREVRERPNDLIVKLLAGAFEVPK